MQVDGEGVVVEGRANGSSTGKSLVVGISSRVVVSIKGFEAS